MAKKSAITEEIKHMLIPKHEKVSDKEKKQVLEKYGVSTEEIPNILITDPAIRHLDPRPGDMIKVTRKSSTAGVSIYYRGVISD